jgi:tetratricopeptide (TPR) repeat protein
LIFEGPSKLETSLGSRCFVLFLLKAEDEPDVDPKYEKNATTPGLAHETTLKLLPIRVSHLCKRSALLQRGNALAALGRQEEARASYEQVFPLITDEPRCARVDWERFSLFINIGNTYSRAGDYDLADEQFKLAEQLGRDHLGDTEGSDNDGHGMVDGAKRARSFALKKAGREEEGKTILKEVIASQIKLKMEKEQKKKDEEEAAAESAEAKPEES